MTAPSWFVQRLDTISRGRLRIRWSPARGEWQIEQKGMVGRWNPVRHWDPNDPGKLLPIDYDDAFLRARDGYSYLLSIRPGDRMPCPACRNTIKVPVLRFGEAICGWCEANGKKKTHYRAAYFPLGEALLQHLEMISPERAYAAIENAKHHQEDLKRDGAIKREASNTSEAILKENFNQLFEIQSVGYTGKEFRG